MCAVPNSLMQVWREYLDQYADHEGDVKRQIIVAAYHGAGIFGSLSRTLDRTGRYKTLINERIAGFEEGSSKAQDFEDCMLVATFTLYNHFNTLGHQFTGGSEQAEDQSQSVTPSIRKVEQRFAAGAARATTPWEHLLNGLYRTVEMMQIFVILSDSELKGEVQEIASRFQEEDEASDYYLKTRNGFCRLFELGHLLTARLDQTL
jgi:hypothetical protein